jgi:CubicO group peptidase (beta-lactamase class C family)
MRRVLGLALAAMTAAGAASAPALAQVPLDPKTPSILQWSPQQERDGFRSIETLFRVNTIRRGKAVHPLPMASTQIQGGFVDDYMKAYDVSGLLVLKDGRIVLERYGLGRKPDDRWTSFSVAKSVTSTLVGAAIQDGHIKSIEDPVTRYIPELKGSGYDGVSVRQLLMMSSGVKWNEDYTDPRSDVAQEGSPLEGPSRNPIVNYMRRLPRAHEPGTTFHYNTGETDLVGILLTNAVHRSLAQYASEKLWKPYGMERDGIWMTDRGGIERGGCCISMTLRDYARVGQFVLDGGVAGGKRILPPWWTARATSLQIKGEENPTGYGWFWWMRDDGYDGRGIFGQSLTVFPKDRVIIVINSAWPMATSRERSAARNGFLAALRAAANGR